MGYGPKWRAHRRAIHRAFNVDVTHEHEPSIARATISLLHNLLETPTKYSDHVHRYVKTVARRFNQRPEIFMHLQIVQLRHRSCSQYTGSNFEKRWSITSTWEKPSLRWESRCQLQEDSLWTRSQLYFCCRLGFLEAGSRRLL